MNRRPKRPIAEDPTDDVPKKKPGRPRFTGQTKTEKEQELTEKAVRIATKKGVEGLSFRAVAYDKKEERKTSATAPLHYFGTFAGMLGAVAEYGLMDLTKRLKNVREANDDRDDPLTRVAGEYLSFALARPNLYQAIHASKLWQTVAEPRLKPKRTDRAKKVTADWAERAERARDDTFAEFEEAAKTARDLGIVRTVIPPDTLAHSVTALVDGFMFHVLQENIFATLSDDEKRDNFNELLDVLMRGARVPGR